MSTIVVSSKGQIVLPAEIRRRLGMGAGARIEVLEEDDGLKLRVVRAVATSELTAMEGMVKGPIEMRSFVTGKTLQVDLPSFYSNPPESLQNLLPTKFEQGPEFFQKKAAGSEEVLKYRNYLKGRAIGWEISAFKPYFPGLKNDGDVAEAARILSQAWGGGLLAAPMMPALQ